MKKLKTIIVFLAIIAISFAGCSKKEVQKPGEEKKQDKPADKEPGTTEDSVQHEVLSFNLEGLTDKGSKKWEVTGESAESISETQVQLKNIVAKAYGDEAEATITADQGVYDKAKNNVRLEKNVNATIDSADKGVGKDYLDFSSGLGDAADPKSSSSSAGKSGEKAAQKENKKTRTVITCDGEVQFDYEQNQAYFNKNVKVVSDDFNIDSDKITVYLDSATKRVKEIVATGNVKITRGENVTYSDKATYLYNDKKIVLTGKPKIVIYQEGGVEGNFLGKK